MRYTPHCIMVYGTTTLILHTFKCKYFIIILLQWYKQTQYIIYVWKYRMYAIYLLIIFIQMKFTYTAFHHAIGYV